MNGWKLAAILSAHADELNEGNDTAEQLLSEHPQASAELRPLFRLAAALQAVLVPVQAPVNFVGRLHKELMTYSPPEIRVKSSPSGQKVLLVGVATAGSVLSVTGLVLLVLRRLRTPGETGRHAVTTAA
jgi:hypothetical protein